MARRFFLLFFAASLLFSCTDTTSDSVALNAPKVKGIATSDSLFFIQKSITFSVQMDNSAGVDVLWRLNGVDFSRRVTFDFMPTVSGRNVITVLAVNEKGRDSMELVFDVFRPRGSKSSKWLAKVFEYNPAPGQFMNTSSGEEGALQGLIDNRGMVSLGGYGGNIVFGFDHTVVNGSGVDFVIHGNAFEGSSEPGAVAVAFDANGNGLPDDEFYELRGSAYERSVKGLGIKYFRPTQVELAENIRWVTTAGKEGFIEKTMFHGQCYYPLFGKWGVAQEINFVGNLVSNPSVEGGDGLWSNPSLEWGYADNYTSDYDAAIGDDAQTMRSNKLDISMAVANDGSSVRLMGVDFVKVYTCVNEQAGPLGEVSSDVCGAISLTPIR